MDRPTVAVYEQEADRWRRRRRPGGVDQAEALAARVAARAASRVHRDRAAPGGGPVADLGCGPGWHGPHLGPAVVALDAAWSMLAQARHVAPASLRVQGDLAWLPFRRGALAGAFAARSYVHLPRPEVPLALAELHRALAPGAPIDLTLFGGDEDFTTFPDDDFGGRRFSAWPGQLLHDVLTGAGFEAATIDETPGTAGVSHLAVSAERARTLPDTVGPGMRLLVCGLNPSVYSADAGIGFARPGNRFWPAALAAGLVERDRDTFDALRRHGIGMTDLVKRATPRADALTVDEYATGLGRVARLVRWLEPGAVCVVGLAGWRAARDRRAVAGQQPDGLGGRPVYLMPSTSGLNAHSRLTDLTEHLRRAAALADSSA